MESGISAALVWTCTHPVSPVSRKASGHRNESVRPIRRQIQDAPALDPPRLARREPRSASAVDCSGGTFRSTNQFHLPESEQRERNASPPHTSFPLKHRTSRGPL